MIFENQSIGSQRYRSFVKINNIDIIILKQLLIFLSLPS